MNLTQSTTPVAEPFATSIAKNWLRVVGTGDDTIIGDLITCARLSVEAKTHRQLMGAVYQLRLDKFPKWVMRIPRPPLVSINSIKYTPSTGGSQLTMNSTDYTVDSNSTPGRITPAYNSTWPSTRNVMNAVLVEYKAGYASTTASTGDQRSAIDQRAIVAVKQLMHNLYDNRDTFVTGTIVAELPPNVSRLVDSLKVGDYSGWYHESRD